MATSARSRSHTVRPIRTPLMCRWWIDAEDELALFWFVAPDTAERRRHRAISARATETPAAWASEVSMVTS